ncbi:hypothetical protein GIB67_026764 [Kingdonia uniflora]|uniref:MLO-like protein n=1 Tax=Kingdonia uniflora TaxID=39325 RepID=A0A7J7MHU8_9MAGN|nr:hypothetical protein GIB67_026764 [Kingdonia uniflora]
MVEEGGSNSHSRELDQTPTWAVATVCAVIIILSIILEKVLHKVGEYFTNRKKMALYEALEKVKGELMVLGFISLLLTFGQNYIARICIPLKAADSMLPCTFRGNHEVETTTGADHGADHVITHEPDNELVEHHRRLLWNQRRFLSAGSDTTKCKAGYEPLISLNGLHQLHIFIFFLAVFHVMYSAVTMLLGRLKIRGWKVWEQETISRDYDPSRFRLTHETSFVKSHNSFWTRTPFFFYVVCFFRQFFRSVRKADYLTMRHGFITVHLASGSKFDFQKYIKRSLEDDFKVVVGIRMAGIILGIYSSIAFGTKLQSIITQMALEIQERHAVVQGIPLVQVSDRHFWFGWPPLVLHLIHFTLFQNAFQITYFFWIWYEFGLKSCFHENFTLIIIRVAMGVLVQVLCSYITLPLYALVTQMGSTMKRSIFDDQTSKALKNWHMKAVKKKTTDGTTPAKTLGGSPMASPQGNGTNMFKSVGVRLGRSSDVEAEMTNMDQGGLVFGTREQQRDNGGLQNVHDLLTGP